MTVDPAVVTRRFCLDKLSYDSDVQITETSDYLTVEPVTLIREGVYPYEDGMALKPGDELEKGAAVSRLYIAWDHPPVRIITRPQEIKGSVDGLRSEKDGKGVKIKGRLTFFKKRMTDDQAELIRSKIRRDVSLGFYFTVDKTPGTWNGQHYDYIQRDFVFDHVASVDHGRCPYPKCGIGVDACSIDDTGMTRIGNDPYPNEHSCRLHSPDDFDPKSFRRIKSGKVSLIMAKREGQTTMTVQAIRYPTSSWSEGEARANCGNHKGSFTPAGSGDSDTVMTNEKKGDTSGQEKFSQAEVNYRPGNEQNPDAVCGNCIFRDWLSKSNCSIVEGTIADNMTCDENTPKPTLERWVLAVKRGNASETSADLTTEQRKDLPDSDFGWIGPKGERKLPMDTKDRTVAALQALQGARGGVDIPRPDLPAVKRKVCARAKTFDIKSEYCGTADANDAVALHRRLFKMPLSDLIKLHQRVDSADDFDKDSLLHRCITLALKKARRKT